MAVLMNRRPDFERECPIRPGIDEFRLQVDTADQLVRLVVGPGSHPDRCVVRVFNAGALSPHDLAIQTDGGRWPGDIIDLVSITSSGRFPGGRRAAAIGFDGRRLQDPNDNAAAPVIEIEMPAPVPGRAANLDVREARYADVAGRRDEQGSDDFALLMPATGAHGAWRLADVKIAGSLRVSGNTKMLAAGIELESIFADDDNRWVGVSLGEDAKAVIAANPNPLTYARLRPGYPQLPETRDAGRELAKSFGVALVGAKVAVRVGEEIVDLTGEQRERARELLPELQRVERIFPPTEERPVSIATVRASIFDHGTRRRRIRGPRQVRNGASQLNGFEGLGLGGPNPNGRGASD